MALRTGTIYVERGWRRRVRGVGFVRRDRWCAELTVGGKRYRCRSASERCVRAWLSDMLERFPEWDNGQWHRGEGWRIGYEDGRKVTRHGGKYPPCGEGKGKTLKTQGYEDKRKF